MILIREAGTVSCGLLAFWAACTMFFQFYVVTICFRQRRSVLYMISTVLNTLFNYCAMQYVNIYARGRLSDFEFRMGQFPVVWLVVLLGISLLLAMLEFFDVEDWEEHHISARAVKNALDALPTGLFYHWENGFPKLVNERMDILCRRLSSEGALDGNRFWEMLGKGSFSEKAGILRTGTEPMVLFENGEVFQFSRKQLLFEGVPLVEITATDITEEYGLGQQLEAENEKVKQINERMREFSADVTDATIAQEILSAKIRIHDNLGSLLLATRRYIEEDEGSDRGSLSMMWRQIMALLRRDNRIGGSDMYRTVLGAAEDVGIGVWIRGELPEVPWQKRIVVTAINECITNTLRHAGGDELRIHTVKTAEETVVTLKNNGTPPGNPVPETGGLGNLRRMAESQGAKMEVSGDPEFTLSLRFDREEA